MSVLNGFPDSQQFRSRALLVGHPVGSYSWLPVKRVFLLDHDTVVLTSSTPSAPYRQVSGGSGLALGDPVVPRRVWILSMKLPEFLQTAYRKVVERLFRSVFAFRIVEPFDKVKDSFVISPAALNQGHNFFHIIFLQLFDVLCFPQYVRGVQGCSMLAGSIGFE